MKKSVVLLGKGDLCIKAGEWFLVNEEYELQCVVPVIPEPNWTSSLISWAHKHNIPVVDDGRIESIPGVMGKNWNADISFSIFYDCIIKPWFIAKCGRILNLHNGPLPRYRGIAPINWALKNGETEHGVTIHEITPGIDDGPIIGQTKFSIYPEIDEVIDVYQRCLDFGWLLFEKTMPLIDSINGKNQDETKATYYNNEDFSQLGDRKSFTRAQSI